MQFLPVEYHILYNRIKYIRPVVFANVFSDLYLFIQPDGIAPRDFSVFISDLEPDISRGKAAHIHAAGSHFLRFEERIP